MLKQSDQLRFVGVRRLFNPPKRCDDFFGQRPEHGHGKTVKRMDSQASPHPTMETSIGVPFAHQLFRCPNLTSMGDFLLELIINHSSHKLNVTRQVAAAPHQSAMHERPPCHCTSKVWPVHNKTRSKIHHIITNKHLGAKLDPTHTLTL